LANICGASLWGYEFRPRNKGKSIRRLQSWKRPIRSLKKMAELFKPILEIADKKNNKIGWETCPVWDGTKEKVEKGLLKLR
jgi:hypothetical protein